jgi:hypothetical protein
LRRSIGLVGATLALAASTAVPEALAGGSHTIRVLGTEGGVVARFHSAKCVANGRGFFGKAVAGNGAILHARIENFSGFHSYSMGVGGSADPYVVYVAPSGKRFTNLNRPPFPSPAGGRMRFKQRGGLIGIGFHPTYSQDGSDAVTIAGVIRCNYPRRHS